MDQFIKPAVKVSLLHISKTNTAEGKTKRIATLTKEEHTAYIWLFEGYSEAWTTETLGLEKRDANKLFKGIYRKLGVRNSREIIFYYVAKR